MLYVCTDVIGHTSCFPCIHSLFVGKSLSLLTVHLPLFSQAYTADKIYTNNDVDEFYSHVMIQIGPFPGNPVHSSYDSLSDMSPYTPPPFRF